MFHHRIQHLQCADNIALHIVDWVLVGVLRKGRGYEMYNNFGTADGFTDVIHAEEVASIPCHLLRWQKGTIGLHAGMLEHHDLVRFL